MAHSSTYPVNPQDILKGEYAANTEHKDFTLSEAVAIKRALEEMERKAAKERQIKGGRIGGQAYAELAEASVKNHGGEARQIVAGAVGVSHTKLYGAEQVADYSGRTAACSLGGLVGFQ